MSLEQGCRKRLEQTEDGRQVLALLETREQQLARTQGWLDEFTGRAAADSLRLVYFQERTEALCKNADRRNDGEGVPQAALRLLLKGGVDIKPEPLAQEIDRMRGRIFELEGYVGRLERSEAQHVEHKHQVYRERNRLVAFLAKCYPAGLATTNIAGWDAEWHGCVYVDSPEGQLSWHVHDSELHQFNFLGVYRKPWDRHSTEEKYARLARLQPCLETSFQRQAFDLTVLCFDTSQGLRAQGTDESDRYWEFAEDMMDAYSKATQQPMMRITDLPPVE